MARPSPPWRHTPGSATVTIRLARRLRRLRDLPARLMLRLANLPLVRRRLAARHDAALRHHSERLPRLSGLPATFVHALQHRGVHVTSLDELALDDSEELVRTATELAGRYAAEARRLSAAGKHFTIVPPEWIVDHPLIYTWGLQDRLLDIAEAHIGLPAAYDGVTLNYGVADGREASTRLWHRDWEDRRMLKIAVYLNDVDEHGGPFELIPRPDPRHSDAHGFDYGLLDSEQLRERIGSLLEEDVVSCVGPRGMVIFQDTARFYHRGKPPTRRDRAVLFYSYFANVPRHPFLCERTGMKRRHSARLARSLNERQRAAVLWRANLPAPLRWIPPARL